MRIFARVTNKNPVIDFAPFLKGKLFAGSSQSADSENVVDGMARQGRCRRNVIWGVDQKAQDAVGDLGRSKTLGAKVQRCDEGGVGVPVGEMESNVSGAFGRN